MHALTFLFIQMLSRFTPESREQTAKFLSAVRSDDLPTIVNALIQFLIAEYGASILENERGEPFLHATVSSVAHFHAGKSFNMPLKPGVAKLKHAIWELLWLYNSYVCVDVITTAILRVCW
jgi:hypothetical protein